MTEQPTTRQSSGWQSRVAGPPRGDQTDADPASGDSAKESATGKSRGNECSEKGGSPARRESLPWLLAKLQRGRAEAAAADANNGGCRTTTPAE